MSSFYSQEELNALGFKKVGQNVLLSKKASIYGAGSITIGNNTRIDDFCILSGTINIGDYVHIAPYCALFGGKQGIEMKDFSGLSSRISIYAESDDYLGEALTNPTIPDKYRKVTGGKVILEKHVIVGTGSSILPNLTIGEGTSVGSMSLVSKSLVPWGVYAGIPCKKIRERSKKILDIEKEFKKHD